MQGVFTKILNLWIPNKTDKGTVVTDVFEPNFTKLDQYAENTNVTLKNLESNKLDKGTYPGDAEKLKEDIDEKMSKYQARYDIMDYDDLSVNGFYILNGSFSGVANSPYLDPALVQVWGYGDLVYQHAVSPYDVNKQFTRCFQIGTKNTKWEKIVNTTDIVNNLTTTVPGQVLDARQGPAIVNKINGLAGGYSGTFPLTTAVKEGIYLLPATNKFYVCVENYSGSSLTAPNANFEELSVFQNRNKLENFFKILYDGAGIESFDISAYQQYNYFLVNVFTYKNSLYDGISTYLISRKSLEDNLDKFGFYMPSGHYNHICLKNNIIEKRSDATVIVQIKTILAFS